MDNHSISAAIIAQDEAANIARCLDSLVGVVDEIVVIDSGSNDDTETICRNYPQVRFLSVAWRGFGAQKQAAVDACQHDRILSLDADECLSEELTASILALRETGFDPERAYYLKRLNNYCGRWIRHCGWYPDKQLRLFDRHHCHWQDVPVHEHIVCNERVTCSVLDGDLLHYSYGSIADHVERINRYSELGAQKVAGKTALGSRAVFGGLFRFFRMYLLNRGFLDGFHGFTLCWLSGMAVFLKYAKARQISESEQRPSDNSH